MLIQGDLKQEDFKSLKKAIRYITREGGFEQALRIFQGLKEEESPLEILKGKGVCYEMIGDVELAGQSYQKGFRESKKANNEEFTYWFWQRMIELISTELSQKGKISQAIKVLKRAAEKDPANARFHRLLSDIYFEQAEYDLGLESLDRFIDLEEDLKKKAAAFLKKGIIWDEMHESEKAEKAYLKAIELDPSFPQPHVYLGFIYGTQGCAEKLSESWQKAERLGFREPFLFCELAILFLSKKDWQQGKEYIGKTIEADPSQVKELLEGISLKEAYQVFLEELCQRQERELGENFLQVLREGKINRDWLEEVLIKEEMRKGKALKKKARKGKKATGKEHWVLEFIGNALKTIKEAKKKVEKVKAPVTSEEEVEEEYFVKIRKFSRRKRFEDEERGTKKQKRIKRYKIIQEEPWS